MFLPRNHHRLMSAMRLLLASVLLGAVVVAAFRSQRSTPVPHTRLYDLKFDPKRITRVELSRPLGLSLEENIENQPRGVFVSDLKEGSAKTSGKVLKGMYLIKVDDKDVKNLDFDSIMDEIIGKPEGKSIMMEFIAFVDVYKGSNRQSRVSYRQSHFQ